MADRINDPAERERLFTAFCDAIAEGVTTKDAEKLVGVGFRSIRLWIGEPDRYGVANAPQRYKAALQASADAWADKATAAVLTATDKDSAAVARVQEDHYRWRAKVANPTAYGDRAQTEVTVNVPALHLDAMRKITATATLAGPPALPAPDIPESD